MKKLVANVVAGASLLALTSGAHADVYSAGPRVYERPFSWTGFYIGVQGGAGWGTTEDSLTAFQSCPTGGPCTPLHAITPPGLLRDSYTINGFHGGGTIGFNYQTGPVVFGVEADVSAADIFGTGNCTDSFGTFGVVPATTGLNASCHTRLNSFGTIAGRLGFASGRTMVFVKAGGAWGEFDRSVITGVTAVAPAVGIIEASASHSDTRWGVVVGTGVEHSLWRGWSAKFEYNFMDFGTENETLRFTGPLITAAFGPTGAVNLRNDDRETVHVVRFGLNYRFGDREVVPLAPLK